MHFLADRVVFFAELQKLGEPCLQRFSFSRSATVWRSESGIAGRRTDAAR